jgi:DNA invertase Pin-like site-specific DNA recombinase
VLRLPASVCAPHIPLCLAEPLGLRERRVQPNADQNKTAAREGRGAALQATEQPINTATAAGKCFLDMLGVFAEFEMNLRRERQLEGIAKAKAAGVYKGRKPTISGIEIKKLKDEGLGATEIAKRLGIGRASVYRALG